MDLRIRAEPLRERWYRRRLRNTSVEEEGKEEKGEGGEEEEEEGQWGAWMPPLMASMRYPITS